jgi:hypothetical protein
MSPRHQPDTDIFVKVEVSLMIQMDRALNEIVAVTGVAKRALIERAVLDFLVEAGVWFPERDEDGRAVSRTRGKTRQTVDRGKETT